jgi:hypothetical protein
MPHSYLPKMKSGTEGTFPKPANVRVWDERPRTHLEMLASSIEIPPAQRRIHSIPDPWARAILFDRALYDPAHTLHDMVVGEWRGMLALLGLRERRSFNGLSAAEVNLYNPPGGTFSAVVSQLRPGDNDLISAETGWDKLYVFRWQRQPFAQTRPRAFAFSSPTTLVCTGADYESIISTDEVPWFNRGPNDNERRMLRDPIRHLGNRERKGLAEWLLIVAEQLVTIGSSSPRKNWVLRTLKAFATDLDSTASVPPEPDRLGERSLKLHHGIYRALDLARKGEAGATSDVEIVTTRPNAPKYVLIEPTIAQQWNVSPQEITVHGDVTLATASRLTSSGKPAIDGVYSWCTPDFFFADRLIYDPNPSAAFPGCLSAKFAGAPQARSVVLPLKPEVLQLFTPHTLAERLTIEWLPNGGASCNLQLFLRSGNQDRPVRIQKTYSESDMTRIDLLPLVGIWPDFRIEGVNWTTYYVFQFWGGTKDELSVEPWSDTERQPAAHRKHVSDPARRFQVYRTNSHPEALVCKTPYFDPAKQREAIATGVLLLKMPPPAQQSPSSSIVLGVDFGSTGTNVYIRAGGGEAKPIVFGKRIQAITDYDIGKFYDLCRDLFIPAKEWTAESILSVFQDFGDPPEGDGARLVIRDGHILYADDPSKFISGDRRRVMSNLKWGGERESIAARDFLMQLCLESAAEVAVQGASAVDIRFSWPTAFSKRDRQKFFGHWQYVTRRATELTGVSFVLNDSVDNSEAVTATRFFSDSYSGSTERMDIVGGALTMDIGGGTTDLAIWNREGLVTHSSVILAGRDLSRAPVRKRPQILNEIDPQVPLESLQGGQRDAAFYAQLDAVVARHGASMIEALAVRQSRRSVQGLLTIIDLGLCGLSFYSGLLLRRLVENGTFKKGRRLAIFVGGNGSKLFKWCALGAPLPNSEIHDRAARAFLAGSNLSDVRIEFHLSPRPKAEVAYGLVSDDLGFKPPQGDFSHSLAGEAFLVGDDAKTWNESVLAKDISGRRVSVDRKFPIFTQFLDAIERRNDEDVLDRIGGHVDLRFAQQAMEIEKAQKEDQSVRASDVIRNEPIFVMALKRYLEMEIDDWERRS